MPTPLCLDCQANATGKIRRGRCENCYRRHISRLKKAGEFQPTGRQPGPPSSPGTITERVFRRTTPGPDGCVIFTGRIDRYGYAMATDVIRAHRAIYKTVIGPIPHGLVLDHVCHTGDGDCAGGNQCRHRRCVNPYHLEPVTPAENNLRGLGLSATNARKTHCINGHEFNEENTEYRQPSKSHPNISRRCRACRHKKGRREYETSRAAARPAPTT